MSLLDHLPSGDNSPVMRRIFSGTDHLYDTGTVAACIGATGPSSTRPTIVANQIPTPSITTRPAHQSGITTATLPHFAAIAFDVTTTSRAELIDLLTAWQIAAERMMRGDMCNADPYSAPLWPNGEVVALRNRQAHRLTITFGFGHSLFIDPDGLDRFCIAQHLPAVLAAGPPKTPGDQLSAVRSGGDLFVQICADDAFLCRQALRNISHIAFGAAALRWRQVASCPPGFEFPTVTAQHLWAQAHDDHQAGWLAGGTYCLYRKISEIVDLEVLQEGHLPPVLRRGYHYRDPIDVCGKRGDGTLVVAFARDPHNQFCPIPEKISEQRCPHGVIAASASALFAIPRGVGENGRFPGEEIFA